MMKKNEDAFSMTANPDSEDISHMLHMCNLLNKALSTESLGIEVGITRCFERRRVKQGSLDLQKRVSNLFLKEGRASIEELSYIHFPRVANKLIELAKNEEELLELFNLLPQFTIKVNNRRESSYVGETYRKLLCDAVNREIAKL